MKGICFDPVGSGATNTHFLVNSSGLYSGYDTWEKVFSFRNHGQDLKDYTNPEHIVLVPVQLID